MVIETVISKYCNRTPLHRQSMILEPDLGLEISRATLRAYLAAILPGLADLPIQRVPDLTPAAWVAQHS